MGSNRNSDIRGTSKIDNQKVNLETENNYRVGNSGNLQMERTLPKLSGGRVFLMSMVGIISAIIISGFMCGLYYNLIRYPNEMGTDYNLSGLCALEKWEKGVNNLDKKELDKMLGYESYLAKEIEYANSMDYKVDFLKKMVSTVSYTPKQVEAIDVYGNPMLDKETDEVLYVDSLVIEKDEEVTLSYIDYTKIPLDSQKIHSIMSGLKLSKDDVDYSNKLVEVFCNYMVSLDDEDIPLVSKEVVPNLEKTSNGYSVSLEEDIRVDKLLFSSDEFYSFLKEFSKVACNGTLTDKNTISMDWCGAYYLMEEYKGVDGSTGSVQAKLGDGSFENPASVGTDIVTSIIFEVEDNEGNITTTKEPIRVKLIDCRLSQEAIDYFESKDVRNRGYDVKSEVQYIAYTFEVTNLSDKTLTVYNNSSLADEQANNSPKTGTIFGLSDECTLKPDETGVIESWGSSTELNKKYVIWGSDFKRREPVIWFRVLAGNIEDTSENKGVTLNKTRND